MKITMNQLREMIKQQLLELPVERMATIAFNMMK